MALILTAQTGEVVTVPQLLGEETEDVANRTSDAEAALKKLEKKMKTPGKLIAIDHSAGTELT